MVSQTKVTQPCVKARRAYARSFCAQQINRRGGLGHSKMTAPCKWFRVFGQLDLAQRNLVPCSSGGAACGLLMPVRELSRLMPACHRGPEVFTPARAAAYRHCRSQQICKDCMAMHDGHAVHFSGHSMMSRALLAMHGIHPCMRQSISRMADAHKHAPVQFCCTHTEDGTAASWQRLQVAPPAPLPVHPVHARVLRAAHGHHAPQG